MPKSSNLTLPFAGDEHVGRFQIAVHDQRAVRRFYRATCGRKYAQAIAHIQTIRLHIIGDGFAVDQFERDVEYRFR